MGLTSKKKGTPIELYLNFLIFYIYHMYLIQLVFVYSMIFVNNSFMNYVFYDIFLNYKFFYAIEIVSLLPLTKVGTTK